MSGIYVNRGLHWMKACVTTVKWHPCFVSVMHESVTCDTVLVTYWSQVCWKRAWGGGRVAQWWSDVTVSVTQGAFALADEGLLVPLHPLELLVSTHFAPLLLLRWVSRVQTLQGTFWSLLRAVGEKRVDNMGKAENKNKCIGKKIIFSIDFSLVGVTTLDSVILEYLKWKYPYLSKNTMLQIAILKSIIFSFTHCACPTFF